ncbi:MAG: hypothetical protein D6696_09930, partial [Acidobacteria bacterium]
MASDRPALAAATGLLLAAGLVLGGCAGEPSGTPFFDLIAELPGAEIHAEARAIVFGDPAGRWHLVDGFWNQIEHDGRRGFVWSSGPSSTVRFELLAARDLVLELEARPLRYPHAPPQTVALVLNGRPLATLGLGPRRATYAVAVPASSLVAGMNVLELRYGDVRQPRQVIAGARDRRYLAVAWYAIILREAEDGGGDAGAAAAAGATRPKPRVEPARGTLFLPWGTAAEYFLELPPGSWLEVERWSLRGAADGRLEVVVESEGGGAAVVAAVDRTTRPRRIALPGAGLVRLALRALPAGGAPA